MTPKKPAPPLPAGPTKPPPVAAKTPAPVDRTVQTRGEFRITFPSVAFLDLEPAEHTNRAGWASPYAIPYRPLGKPDLHMKLSPNLRSPHVLNESQPKKSHELRSESTTHYALDFAKDKGDGAPVLPLYSPSHIKHLQCPHRTQHDPSFSMLQHAIHEGSLRRCSVKYGACVFSRTIVPTMPTDVTRGPSAAETSQYLPYTTRKPQVPPLPQLPSLFEFRAKADAESHGSGKNHAASSTSILENSLSASASSNTALGVELPLLEDTPPRSTFVAELAHSLDDLVPTTATLHGNTSQSSLNSFVALHLLGRDGVAPVNATAAGSTLADRPPHGVERLQDVVRARERAKQLFSHQLLVLLRALENDRWQSFCLKFAHFRLHRDLDHDLFAMREGAESERQARIAAAVAATGWFTAFLALVLKHTAAGAAAPAPLVFLADGIRQAVNQGHRFQPALLFGLVLCLHEDELETEATQMALKFLRTAAPVALPDWEHFFESARLPPPIEVIEFRQVDAVGKSKHMRMKHLVKTAGMMSHLKAHE
ncbi:hypothetical protein ACHHYP_07575 [Achlya hypogyna]|uniref:Uncharacterized protein n=1 Tax=Achlya hypogyna TaxID=1202772 RepID=A0A1V9YQS3_ACHHY|nr:hypothetical protein ACHHYP_07575 [Achlya hypogyna]